MKNKKKIILIVFIVVIICVATIAGIKSDNTNKHNESKYVGAYDAVTYVDGVEDTDLSKEFCLCLNAEDSASICIDHVVHSGKWKESKEKITIYDEENGNVIIGKEDGKLVYKDGNQKTYFEIE